MKMLKNKVGAFAPVIIFFISLNVFFIIAKNLLDKWNADQAVLIIGNLILFVITFISFSISKKGLYNTNPHAFVRSVYGSMMIKMFICIFIAFLYIAIYKKSINKPALFTCMGLYLVYTFIEVSILTKLLKQQKNG